MPSPFYLRMMCISAAITTLCGCASFADKNAGSVGLRLSSSPTTVLPSAVAQHPHEESSQQQTLYLRPTTTESGQGLSSPNDMWDRIRRGFSMPDLDNQLVRDREAWYTQRPEYIERMVGRSNKYLYHIVEEIERRGMPTEIALLPYIESAFNPQALSSARAAGLWQFIPSTGRHFSLRQNLFQDDRRHVLRSTRAALDYLQRLYTMFGDWHLALAAYNWGEGNVQRALRRNPGASYADLPMPQETRLYVPKLQALKNLIRNPATFNTELPDVPNHPFFQSVPIQRDMDVAAAIRLAEISETDFRALNPALNKPLIIAALNPRILLPWESVATFQRNLAATGNQPLASWTVWVVPRAMTLAEVAHQHGTSADELRRINPRIPPGRKVLAGSTLLVPRSGGGNISASIAQSGNITLAPEIVLRRTTVKARRGDSIAKIAARYGLPAQTVAKWNKVRAASAALRPGQAIVLHLPKQVSRSTRHLAASTRSNSKAISTQRDTRHTSTATTRTNKAGKDKNQRHTAPGTRHSKTNRKTDNKINNKANNRTHNKASKPSSSKTATPARKPAAHNTSRQAASATKKSGKKK